MCEIVVGVAPVHLLTHCFHRDLFKVSTVQDLFDVLFDFIVLSNTINLNQILQGIQLPGHTDGNFFDFFCNGSSSDSDGPSESDAFFLPRFGATRFEVLAAAGVFFFGAPRPLLAGVAFFLRGF